MRRLLILGSASLLLVVAGAGAVFAGEKANNTIQIALEAPDGSHAADATGRVQIGKEYQEDHPNWDDWPMSIGWWVKDLPCTDFGFDRSGGENGGDHSYALYIYNETKGLVRLTQFNTNCQDGSFESWMVLPDYMEAELRDSPVSFGIVLEADDGLVQPGALLLLGSTEDPPLLP